MGRFHTTPDGNIPFTVAEEAEADTREQSAKDNLAQFGYIDKRKRAFPELGEQLDMQYHDQLDGTTTWKDAIAKVKADNPKP